MSSKQKKAIKRLKKQVKKLKTRVDAMGRELGDLKLGGQASGNVQKGSGPEIQSTARFTEEEVETAMEAMENAEELEDMLEKTKQ